MMWCVLECATVPASLRAAAHRSAAVEGEEAFALARHPHPRRLAVAVAASVASALQETARGDRSNINGGQHGSVFGLRCQSARGSRRALARAELLDVAAECFMTVSLRTNRPQRPRPRRACPAYTERHHPEYRQHDSAPGERAARPPVVSPWASASRSSWARDGPGAAIRAATTAVREARTVERGSATAQRAPQRRRRAGDGRARDGGRCSAPAAAAVGSDDVIAQIRSSYPTVHPAAGMVHLRGVYRFCLRAEVSTGLPMRCHFNFLRNCGTCSTVDCAKDSRCNH